MKVLLDSCVWGGVRAALSEAGHDIVWAEPFPARTTIAAAALPLGACVEIDLVVKT